MHTEAPTLLQAARHKSKALGLRMIAEAAVCVRRLRDGWDGPLSSCAQQETFVGPPADETLLVFGTHEQ